MTHDLSFKDDGFMYDDEEITLKRNHDGTYFVTRKMVAYPEGTHEPPFDVVMQIPRANVSIKALAANDDKQTLYTVTIPDKVDLSEIPKHQTTVDDWKMLGYREEDAKKLCDVD